MSFQFSYSYAQSIIDFTELCVAVRRHCKVVLFPAEQPGGAAGSEERRPTPALPALFKEVGPLVEDWEKYLKGLADNLDQRPAHSNPPSTPLRPEESLFLQVGGCGGN